jgi:GT2 family glycosyltransferase
MQKKILKLPFVSVVIPIFNSISHIEAFLDSLLKTDYENVEFIIIDDNSNDGTKEYLSERAKKNKKIVVVETFSRLGLTKSRNLGIQISKGEYIAFAEVDMLFDEKWLIEAVKVLEKDKKLGAVCGKVLDVKTNNIINAVGIKTIPQIGWVVSRGIGEKDKGQFDEPVDCNIGSVGSITRAAVMRKIRGFDEELDRIDDTDYGWRIWLMGYRIVTVPSSITYHVVVKKWKLRKKNVTMIQQEMAFGRTLRMLVKNYEMKNIAIFFPQALAILLVRAGVNLLRGNVYSLIGCMFVFAWFIKTFPSTLKERRYIQNNRVFSDDVIFHKMMVTGNLLDIYRDHARSVYLKVAKVPSVG